MTNEYAQSADVFGKNTSEHTSDNIKEINKDLHFIRTLLILPFDVRIAVYVTNHWELVVRKHKKRQLIELPS